MSLERNKQIAIESFRLIESGDAALADRIIASDFVNREAEDDRDNRKGAYPGQRVSSQQANGYGAPSPTCGLR
jgi:hypothetical protein